MTLLVPFQFDSFLYSRIDSLKDGSHRWKLRSVTRSYRIQSANTRGCYVCFSTRVSEIFLMGEDAYYHHNCGIWWFIVILMLHLSGSNGYRSKFTHSLSASIQILVSDAKWTKLMTIAMVKCTKRVCYSNWTHIFIKQFYYLHGLLKQTELMVTIHHYVVAMV